MCLSQLNPLRHADLADPRRSTIIVIIFVALVAMDHIGFGNSQTILSTVSSTNGLAATTSTVNNNTEGNDLDLSVLAVTVAIAIGVLLVVTIISFCVYHACIAIEVQEKRNDQTHFRNDHQLRSLDNIKVAKTVEAPIWSRVTGVPQFSQPDSRTTPEGIYGARILRPDGKAFQPHIVYREDGDDETKVERRPREYAEIDDDYPHIRGSMKSIIAQHHSPTPPTDTTNQQLANAQIVNERDAVKDGQDRSSRDGYSVANSPSIKAAIGRLKGSPNVIPFGQPVSPKDNNESMNKTNENQYGLHGEISNISSWSSFHGPSQRSHSTKSQHPESVESVERGFAKKSVLQDADGLTEYNNIGITDEMHRSSMELDDYHNVGSGRTPSQRTDLTKTYDNSGLVSDGQKLDSRNPSTHSNLSKVSVAYSEADATEAEYVRTPGLSDTSIEEEHFESTVKNTKEEKTTSIVMSDMSRSRSLVTPSSAKPTSSANFRAKSAKERKLSPSTNEYVARTETEPSSSPPILKERRYTSWKGRSLSQNSLVTIDEKPDEERSHKVNSPPPDTAPMPTSDGGHHDNNPTHSIEPVEPVPWGQSSEVTRDTSLSVRSDPMKYMINDDLNAFKPAVIQDYLRGSSVTSAPVLTNPNMDLNVPTRGASLNQAEQDLGSVNSGTRDGNQQDDIIAF